LAVQFLRNEKAHSLATDLDKNLAIHYLSLASLSYDLISRGNMTKKELRDVLNDMDKERMPKEFICWLETAIAELERNPSLYEEEVLLKRKDSQREDTAKKFREEICSLLNFLKCNPEYIVNKLKYNPGDEPYDVVVIGSSSIEKIEIVSATSNSESAQQDKELLKKGSTVKALPNVEQVVNDLIASIATVLAKKVAKDYQGKYALIIGFDDSSLTATPFKKAFLNKLGEKVWKKGNFVDVFVVGYGSHGICKTL
jgi:hypothetical protein